jgi:hypothetical protein
MIATYFFFFFFSILVVLDGIMVSFVWSAAYVDIMVRSTDDSDEDNLGGFLILEADTTKFNSSFGSSFFWVFIGLLNDSDMEELEEGIGSVSGFDGNSSDGCSTFPLAVY